MLVAAWALYLLRMVSLGRDDPWVGLEPNPRACRGEGTRQIRTPPPGSCDPDVGISQAPEHVEGEGSLLYEEGGGSAQLVADDCLKYLFI
jgi:hypothetical protein